MIYIFDLDGTLSLTDHRQHFVRPPATGLTAEERGVWSPDWGAFFEACDKDPVNIPVARIANLVYAACERSTKDEMWIVSGRSDQVKVKTMHWLDDHGIQFHQLIMRKEGDHSPDDELKRSWIYPVHNQVAVVFDDRDKVVAMWRRMGIPCFQVAPGDF